MTSSVSRFWLQGIALPLMFMSLVTPARPAQQRASDVSSHAAAAYQAGHTIEAVRGWQQALKMATAEARETCLRAGTQTANCSKAFDSGLPLKANDLYAQRRFTQAFQEYLAYNRRSGVPNGVMQSGVAFSGGDAAQYVMKGLEYAANGNRQAAIAQWKAATADDRFPETRFLLGAEYFSMGNRAEAIRQWLRALSCAMPRPEILQDYDQWQWSSVVMLEKFG
jgi:tetratricopeptide (TPR) repeat protein